MNWDVITADAANAVGQRIPADELCILSTEVCGFGAN